MVLAKFGPKGYSSDLALKYCFGLAVTFEKEISVTNFGF